MSETTSGKRHLGMGFFRRLLLKGGGVQGKFFGGSDALIIGETFGVVLGPRRPTVSERRPAQKLGVK